MEKRNPETRIRIRIEETGFLINEAMIGAAPKGTPPPRIRYKISKKLIVPPCLGEALRRGTLKKFL